MRPPGEDEVQRPLAPDQAREQRRGHGREDGELDLGLAELEVVPGQDHVAGERQLAPAAERRAVHQRHDGNLEGHQLPDRAVEELEHAPDAVGGVVGHVHAGGERAPGARHREDLEPAVRRRLGERRLQRLHAWPGRAR